MSKLPIIASFGLVLGLVGCTGRNQQPTSVVSLVTADESKVIVSTDDGRLYESNDSGASWTELYYLDNGYFKDLIIADGSIWSLLYPKVNCCDFCVCSVTITDIARSVDGGQTFSFVSLPSGLAGLFAQSSGNPIALGLDGLWYEPVLDESSTLVLNTIGSSVPESCLSSGIACDAGLLIESCSGQYWFSSNRGDTWELVEVSVGYQTIGLDCDGLGNILRWSTNADVERFDPDERTWQLLATRSSLTPGYHADVTAVELVGQSLTLAMQRFGELADESFVLRLNDDGEVERLTGSFDRKYLQLHTATDGTLFAWGECLYKRNEADRTWIRLWTPPSD